MTAEASRTMNDWIRGRAGLLPDVDDQVDDNAVPDFDGGARSVPPGPVDMNRELRRRAGYES